MVIPRNDLEADVTALYEGLASLTYYDFLGIRPACDYVAVRHAFYDRAQRFHPDRFVSSSDPGLVRAAYEVYKRIAEAFNVLLDPHLRIAYDEARLRGDVRLSEAARARRLSAEERQCSNPIARIYLRSAKAKLERGELRAAWIDVELGLSLEQAAPLVALSEEIAARVPPAQREPV